MKRPDEEIKKDLFDHLYRDSRVDASDVSIEVHEGRVFLQGTVPSLNTRRLVEQMSVLIPGVADVDSRVEVRRPDSVSMPSDAEIQVHARNALKWSADIDAADVQVAVHDGLVVLSGAVDAYWKKVQAEDLVSRFVGVVDVENKLTVVPTRDVEDLTIAEEIAEAIDRNAFADPELVTVQVEGGIVTLSGEVPSWQARTSVHDSAVATLGVRDVIDRLEVVQG